MNGFSVQIIGLNLTDVIQMNCTSQTKNKMIIHIAEGKREIFFQNRRVGYLICNNLERKKVFYKIREQKGGEFSIEESSGLPEGTKKIKWKGGEKHGHLNRETW